MLIRTCSPQRLVVSITTLSLIYGVYHFHHRAISPPVADRKLPDGAVNAGKSAAGTAALRGDVTPVLDDRWTNFHKKLASEISAADETEVSYPA